MCSYFLKLLTLVKKHYGRSVDKMFDEHFVPFRYQGQYADEETELYYNRFRYYDPQLGQYITQDPIGLAGNNPTLYGYVSDPNFWIDPFGLKECHPDGMGAYKKVQGHHPMAGSAFSNFKAYKYQDALAIGMKKLKELGVDHRKITGQQNSLYTAWAKANPGKELTLSAMKKIEIQAMVNLGVPLKYATTAVNAAIKQLKSWGITKPSKIPWN